MKLSRLLLLFVFAVFMVAMPINAFAQISTVYVDVTNGSDSYSGANVENDPAGSGPKATINAGLAALADGGTLVILAGTYNGGDGAAGAVNITTPDNVTIELRKLSGNNDVLLSAGDFNFNTTQSGTLTITTTNGTEYLTLKNDLVLGSGTRDVSVALSNANFVKMTTGKKIVINGSSSFTNQAPSWDGTSPAINIEYQGDDNITAGPESQYGDFNAGVITVNKSAGDKVTFSSSITEVSGISVTSGDAEFTADVAVKAGTTNDITNTGSGTLTFAQNLDLEITDGTADANLVSIEANTGNGDIVVTGTVTWTAAVTGNQDISGLYVIDNAGTGDVTLNNTLTFVADKDGSVDLTVRNNSSGTLSLGDVVAAKSATNTEYVNVNVAVGAAAGTVVIGGGDYRGSVVNANTHKIQFDGATNITGNLTNTATGKLDINADVSVAGVFTNPNGTADHVDLGTNTLTLSSCELHPTNGGVMSGAGKVEVTAASPAALNILGTTVANPCVVNVTAHGLLVGQQVYISGSDDAALADGYYTVTVVGDVDHFTIAVDNTGGDDDANGTAQEVTTFNGGTLPEVEMNKSTGKLGFAANAVTLGGLTVASGAVNAGIGTDVNGTASITGGDLQVSAVTLETEDFSQTGGTVTLTADAASILDVNGDFDRTTAANTFVAGDGSFVKFTGAAAQTINGGSLWEIENLTFTNTVGTITLGHSVRVDGNILISSNTGLALATKNIILNDTDAGIVNSGSYTASGGGGVIFGGANTVANGANRTGQTMSGNGTYSYITVDVGAANTVTVNVAGEKVKFNGVLTLLTGTLDIDDGGAGTLDFAPTGTSAKIIRNLETSPGLTVSNGTFNTDTPADYDIEYIGTITADKTVTVGSNEFDSDNVRNLTLGYIDDGTNKELELVSAGAVTIKGDVTVTTPTADNTVFNLPTQDIDIQGTLDVQKGTEIAVGNGGNTLTLSGDSKAHTIVGKISAANILTVTGNSSSITGSTDATADAEVLNLYFEPADVNYSFSATNLKKIADDLGVCQISTKTGASATITMDSDDATITDDVMVDNGATVALTVAGATTSVLGGDVVLTDGSLSLTRGGNSTVVGGKLDLDAGTFTLGSDVEITGVTEHTAADIALGENDLTMVGDYTRDGTGGVTGTGWMIVKSAANPATFTTGTSFTVPNLEFNNTVDDQQVDVPNSFEVTGAFKVTNGDVDVANAQVLTISAATVEVLDCANTDLLVTGTGAYKATGTTELKVDGALTIGDLVLDTDGVLTLKESSATEVATTITLTDFTMTKGTIDQRIHDLNVTNFARTAGTFTQTSGVLVMADATPTLGTDFLIDNLQTTANVDVSAAKEKLTVYKSLQLDGDLTVDADGDLSLGDGCLIHRTDNAAVLNKVPSFGANIDLKYSTYTGATDIAIAKEAPATIRDLTVLSDGGAQKITLSSAKTITGTLSLADMLNVTAASPDGEIIMAEASTLELKVDGTSALDKDLSKEGSMNLVYNGASNTTTREMGAITSGAHPTYNGDVTFKSGVTIDAATHTLNGTLTFNGGDFTTTANQTVNVQGDVICTTDNFFLGTGTVMFTGDADQTITLKADRTIPAGQTFGINKTNIDDAVTISGGDIDFAANSIELQLQKGVLATGSQKVVLEQANNGSGQPTQGFVRNYGVVYGNIEKFINRANTVDISSVEYPTGSPEGNYRPAKFYFKNVPPLSVSLLVRHETDSPGGKNGIPFNTGSVQVTSYPDFYWKVETDLNSINPSYQFDMELQAEDYAFYETDDIESVRMIRRAQGSVDNQWRLQGDDTKYDNQTVSSSWPLVKVIDATGGLTTEGSIFTFSQSSKAPRWSIAPVPAPVDENDNVVYQYRAVDEDINEWPSIEVVGELPSFVSLETFASDAADNENVAATDSCTLTIAPTYADSGSYEITLRATDGIDFVDSTFTLVVNDVNQPTSFVTVPGDTTIDEGSVFTFTYVVEDLDGDTPQFAVVDSVGDDIAITDEGVLSFTAPAGTVTGLAAMVVVSVGDGIDPAVNDTLNLTIMKPVAPVFADVMPDSSVRTGDTLTYAYTATDENTPAGDILKYALVSDVEGASIIDTTGAFSFVAADSVANKTLEIIVSVTDASGNAVYDTAEVSIKSNVLGDVDLSGKLQSYDASLTLQHVVKKITLTGDSLALADVSGAGGVSAYDASWIFIKVLNPDTALFDQYGPLAKTVVAAGEANWSLSADVTDEKFVNVPVTISNASDIYSFEFTAEVDPSKVNVEDVSMSLPQGWQTAQNIENGVIRVAAFGTTPVNASTIGNIKLEVLNEYSAPEMSGSIVLNENNSRDMETLAVRSIPNSFKLSQNYPNPFNPTTNIAYQIPEANKVVINIYDMLGNKVSTLVNENRAAGYHMVQWNGLNNNGARMASGTYFYHIQAGSYNSTKKMLLIK